MPPVVFVLLDGLAAATARPCMGYMQSLVDAGKARYTELNAELPPLSRPIYATLLSGKRPVESGIAHNDCPCPCPKPHIFSRVQAAGRITAAAAYHWMSELCNSQPFEPARDRHTDTPALPIAHGHFYSTDAYPDDEVFHDAASLQRLHSPHFLLVHSMGIDNAGHLYGADSREYRTAARRADGLLARWLPRWAEAGYAVLITSDHGMNADGNHNDASDACRRVPLWLVGEGWNSHPLPQDQTQIADLVCAALGIA